MTKLVTGDHPELKMVKPHDRTRRSPQGCEGNLEPRRNDRRDNGQGKAARLAGGQAGSPVFHCNHFRQ